MPVVLPTPEEAAALRVTDADHAARGAVLASSRHLRLTPAVWDRLWVVASRAGRKAAADARVTEQRTQAALIRCVVGNPFRPAATITPAVMASHGGGTLRLAEAIYDGRWIEDLPVLADLLEAAGLADAGLLGHLRGPGPHALGCHELDAVLGKS